MEGRTVRKKEGRNTEKKETLGQHYSLISVSKIIPFPRQESEQIALDLGKNKTEGRSWVGH